MSNDDRLILNANLGRMNVVNFDKFSEYAITTLRDISEMILPLCGVDALHNLVIYRNMATEFTNNVFSNDGIHILKNMEHLSPIQTYIANYIRYIAERVERAAADGTSTAIYFASELISAVLTDVRGYRDTFPDGDITDVDSCRAVMHTTHEIANSVLKMLRTLLKVTEKLVIDFKMIDPELREALIYRLAYTTSKQNKLLTEYTVELFKDLPELLYEHTNYRRAQIETDEDLMIERPDHDVLVTVMASNNTVFNSKLGTELLYESCDLLICPKMFGKVDLLIQYFELREADPIASKIPLIVLFNGADDNEYTRIVAHAKREFVTVCRHTVYHPVFANNPLELNVIQVMGGIEPIIQEEVLDFKTSILSGVKCRLYGKELYISNLFDHETAPLHPSYVRDDFPSYTKLRLEIEERINTLRSAHNNKEHGPEINEFVRLYRNMICSRLPILTIGGSTINHLANINVVDDVLGVVSVAMKHGVILDLIPKLQRRLTVIRDCDFSKWLISFTGSVTDFSRLTYRCDDVCTKLKETDLSTEEQRDYMFVNNKWVKLTVANKDDIVVVQSYRAISETLLRLIETIPRIICTDRIIVPNSVMDNKKE